MKLRILTVSTVFVLLSFSPLHAAEPPKRLPAALEERVVAIVKACLTHTIRQVAAIEQDEEDPRFVIPAHDGQWHEVSRDQFIAFGTRWCADNTVANDPDLAPYLAPLQVTDEKPS